MSGVEHRFVVDGGYIIVRSDGDGTVTVRGLDQGVTHMAALTITPRASNSVRVGLTPHSKPAPEPEEPHVTNVSEHSGHWDASCSAETRHWSVVNLPDEAGVRALAENHEARWNA